MSKSCLQKPATKAVGSGVLVRGRYRVGAPLMRCRFSTLLSAHDELTGLPLVLKRWEGQVAGREARLQILREGRLFSTLRHRNLPQLRGVLEQDDAVYLVLENMVGQDLSTLLHQKREFGAEVLRRISAQLLSVLDYLHHQEKPIIYRDLRPGTVLLTPMNVIKLGEFGLAKMDMQELESCTAFKTLGDPHFSSPEQLLGEASRPRQDLYSLGALLYALASGKTPPASLERLQKDQLVPLGRLNSEVSDDFASLVERLLCIEPERRPQSVLEVQGLLGIESAQKRRPQALMKWSSVDSSGPNRERKSSMWQLLFGKKKTGPNVAEERPKEVTEPTAISVDLATVSLDRKTGRTLSEALSRSISGVCIGRVSGTDITVACKDPSDVHIYDNIAMAATPDFRVRLVKADEALIDKALDFIFRTQYLSADTSWEVYLEQRRLDSETLEMTSQSAPVNFDDEALEGPVVEAVDKLIKEALSAGASDIHLEPYEDGLEVRYRIDGVLRSVNRLSVANMSAVVKRLKVMGNLDIAQERLTQGGRISLRLGDREYDLRVSVIPVPAGESVVMRVLQKGSFTLTLSDLGFESSTEERFRRLLTQPYGMILVSGPTGSGKSTTLYASLKEISRPDRKLLTVEDPIEYQMPGIMQVQVNRAPRDEDKKLTFSRALREFLRQDPDVILVGEIRDQETAEISVQAALTGHLLLSTIHTNDAIGIISRLRDMKCEPFLVSSVLLGGVAQRLARRLCPDCREESEVPKCYRGLFEQNGVSQVRAYQSRGCRACNQSGSRGRLGIYELLEMTPELRNLITDSASEEAVRSQAIAQGYRPLLSDGLHKVSQGLVSLEEVLRVCRTAGQGQVL